VVGIWIVTVLFALFAISAVTSAVRLDEPVALAFLGIGSVLIGLPLGWRIAVLRNGRAISSLPPPGASPPSTISEDEDLF
jgi:hypothetical protein